MSKTPDLTHTRNIGIAAHVDAGKTTLTERILFYTGASYKIGEVHDGAAHMDYMFEEQSHGITINSAVTRATWQDHLIQVIDTPGHVDFTIEVERAMRILDGCILVLDGVRGVEPQTETVWRQRNKFQLPALFFINKMDRPGADFDHSMQSIRKRLKGEPVPITVPLPEQNAVVHLIDKSTIYFDGEHGEILRQEPCDDATWNKLSEQREALLLSAAEFDESLADMVLADEEPATEAIWAALRTGTLAGKIHPCFGGTALHNQGVQPVLDGVIRLLPSPLDRPAALAHIQDGAEETVQLDAKDSLVALAFKVQLWDGRRHVYVRIYRGQLRPGDKITALQPNGQQVHETVARMFEVDAGKKSRLDLATAGEIVLIAGLRQVTTGDTICNPEHILVLERIDTREPVLSLAVEPQSGEDEEKFLEVLDKVQQEDPTLLLEDDPDTGQRLLRGMGELHLQIVLERLQREFNLQIRSGKPAVALRETITRSTTAECLFQPHYDPKINDQELKARVVLDVEPLERGSGTRIIMEPEIEPEGQRLNQAQLETIEEALETTLSTGPIEAAPLEDLELRVTMIELFGKASTTDALQAAAVRACIKAVQQADPCLLHPIMAAEVVVPEENLGQVLGDLQARLGVILDTTKWKESATISCEVALDKLLGYTTDLRSMTQGRGHFSTIFKRFDRV
ncbi:MAG: GTP-binding protein [Gammaproteobacteria bacterium]|nr:GTP-binding protein [Gammaproteobacteria bacterium]